MPTLVVLALLVLGAAQSPARAQSQASEPVSGSAPSTGNVAGLISVQEIARVQGQGESKLRGIGIVLGLPPGRGDEGKDLLIARPLAKIYEANGNPLPDLRELAAAKTAAIVSLTVTIPATGARADDKLDVQIAAMHSAKSLAGGQLYLSPLSGPLPGQGVFAIAAGPITIDDPSVPTSGKVRLGASMIRDVLMPTITDQFTLIVKPYFRGAPTTSLLAETVNSLAPEVELGVESTAGQIASAIDDVAVRVDIPKSERTNPTRFIAKVLSATFSPSLLRLPALVVANERSGIIIVTGNVEVSPVVISHKDLVISTTTPAPLPSPANPLVTTTRWAALSTTGRNSERTRIQDLLGALKTLDVPVGDQIRILAEIDRAGRLHGQLVVE